MNACIPDPWWLGFLLGTALMSTVWAVRAHSNMLWFRSHVGSLLHILRKLSTYREVPLSVDDRARIQMAINDFVKTK